MESVEITEDDQNYYQELVTRAASYIRPCLLESEDNEPSAHRLAIASKRNTLYLKCKVLNSTSKKNDYWKQENADCHSCFVFNSSDNLPNGVLPTNLSAIQLLISYKDIIAKKGQKWNSSPEYSAAKDVALHWIFCNVYPITLSCIKKN